MTTSNDDRHRDREPEAGAEMDLLPCPFCGGRSQSMTYPAGDGHNHAKVECNGCLAEMHGYSGYGHDDPRDDARERWNTRSAALKAVGEG